MSKPKCQEKFYINVKYLKQLRDEAKLRQEDIAKAINISRVHYNFIENGKYQSISIKILTKLSKYYNVPIANFFKIEGRKGIDDLTLQEFKEIVVQTFGINFEGISYPLIPTPELIRLKVLYFDSSLDKPLYDFFSSYEYWSLVKPTGSELKYFINEIFKNLKDKSIDNIAKTFMEIREHNLKFRKE